MQADINFAGVGAFRYAGFAPSGAESFFTVALIKFQAVGIAQRVQGAIASRNKGSLRGAEKHFKLAICAIDIITESLCKGMIVS